MSFRMKLNYNSFCLISIIIIIIDFFDEEIVKKRRKSWMNGYKNQ